MSDPIILRDGQAVNLKVFDFPAGELGVKIDGAHWRLAGAPTATRHTVIARIQSSRDLVALIMVTDALRRLDPIPVHLVLPYVPYGRQDRVCVSGEAFSLKVVAGLINGLGFETVTTFDPHSDVTGALIDRLVIKTQVQIVNQWDDLRARLMNKSVVLVSPDAGAGKKTAALAAYLGKGDYVRADKKRDLETGKLTGTVVYADDLTGQTVAIVDDICDYGGTFVLLAKALKAKGAAKIILYVTHGLFGKGLDPLFEAGITEIWTTDAYRTDLDSRAKVLKIDDILRNT